MPGPDGHLGGDPGLGELTAQRAGERRQQGVGAVLVPGQQGAAAGVLLRVQGGEDDVLQLRLQHLDAEPLGQRDQHVPGDLGDPHLTGRLHVPDGPHVVQPVGELDHHHPDVVPGGDQHLAEGLRLRRRPEVDLLQFGHPVDQVGDFGAEPLGDLTQRQLGVLHGVVEQRGDQSRGAGAELGQDHGDGQRMGDVRLAALPLLAPVALLGQPVGTAEQAEVGLRMVSPVGLDQRFEGVRHRRAAGGQQRGAPGASERGPAQSAERPSGPGLPCGRRLPRQGLPGFDGHRHLRQRYRGRGPTRWSMLPSRARSAMPRFPSVIPVTRTGGFDPIRIGQTRSSTAERPGERSPGRPHRS